MSDETQGEIAIRLPEEPYAHIPRLLDAMTWGLPSNGGESRHPFFHEDTELPEGWSGEREALLRLFDVSAKLYPTLLPDYEIADDSNSANWGELLTKISASNDEVAKLGVATLLRKHRQVTDLLFPTPPTIGLHEFFVTKNAAKIGYNADTITMITELNVAPPPTRIYALLEGIKTDDKSKRLFDLPNGGSPYETSLNKFQILLAEMIILDYLVRYRVKMAPRSMEIRLEALQLAYDTLEEFRVRKVE